MAVTQASRAVIKDYLIPFVNVKEFGAIGDLATDDTVAIQACIDASVSSGQSVYFPAGKYRVSSPLKVSPYNNMKVFGDGVNISQIRSTVAGSPTLLVGDHTTTSTRTFELENISVQYDGASPPVAGTIGIHCKNLVSPTNLKNFSIQKFYDGLRLEATSLQGNILISDFVIGNTESKGIELKGGVQGVWISKGKITARDNAGTPATGSIGIQVTYANGVYVDTVDSLLNERGCVIIPSVGETAHWLFFNNLICDTNNGAGIDINPQGGTVRGLNFKGCWASSNKDIGLKIRGSAASVVDGILIDNMQCTKNWFQGVRLLGGPATFRNIDIRGGQFLSNNQSNTSLPAIQVDSNISDFSIQGANCGSQSLFPNYQSYSIRVFAGTSDNYSIIGNTGGISNVTGVVRDDGTGVNKIVTNNI